MIVRATCLLIRLILHMWVPAGSYRTHIYRQTTYIYRMATEMQAIHRYRNRLINHSIPDAHHENNIYTSYSNRNQSHYYIYMMMLSSAMRISIYILSLSIYIGKKLICK